MDLEVGDYVLVKSLGLGVITKLTDAKITIGFEKKKEKSFIIIQRMMQVQSVRF